MENGNALSFDVELPGGRARLREATIYVCIKCNDATRFGKVKLNKILWRADFEAFRARRIPVTGTSYQKLAAGPAPLDMPLVLQELQSGKLLKIEIKEHEHGYEEHRPIAIQNINYRWLNKDDLSYLDESIQYYWNKSASKASDLSHKVAWKTRDMKGLMPYESAFFSDKIVTGIDRNRLLAIAERKGMKSR